MAIIRKTTESFIEKPKIVRWVCSICGFKQSLEYDVYPTGSIKDVWLCGSCYKEELKKSEKEREKLRRFKWLNLFKKKDKK